MKLLAINPGSTSTKIAVFEDDKNIFQKNLQHDTDALKQFHVVTEQFEFRKKAILNLLKEAGFDVNEFNAIVGRGGFVRPIPSGVFAINDKMKEDLLSCKYGEHASNLGALIADDIAKTIPNCLAVIVDPVVVDELQDVARLVGHPLFKRTAASHALNQKAIARRYAKEVGKPYDELNLILTHLGGGISVGAHKQGKVIDGNNAIEGEGPFSPERSGGLPVMQVVQLCFSGKYTLAQIKKMMVGEGGLVAYLGTNNIQKVEEEMIPAGNQKAIEMHEAMAYNVAKEIGAMATVLEGKVDAILLTGGIAFNPLIIGSITKKVGFIAPVKVYPGEDEMGALASNGFAALRGEREIHTY